MKCYHIQQSNSRLTMQLVVPQFGLIEFQYSRINGPGYDSKLSDPGPFIL